MTGRPRMLPAALLGVALFSLVSGVGCGNQERTATSGGEEVELASRFTRALRDTYSDRPWTQELVTVEYSKDVNGFGDDLVVLKLALRSTVPGGTPEERALAREVCEAAIGPLDGVDYDRRTAPTTRTDGTVVTGRDAVVKWQGMFESCNSLSDRLPSGTEQVDVSQRFLQALRTAYVNRTWLPLVQTVEYYEAPAGDDLVVVKVVVTSTPGGGTREERSLAREICDAAISPLPGFDDVNGTTPPTRSNGTVVTGRNSQVIQRAPPGLFERCGEPWPDLHAPPR